jgi:hypothetical protein
MRSKTVEELEATASGDGSVLLNRERLVRILDKIIAADDIASLRDEVLGVKRVIASPDSKHSLLKAGSNGNAVFLRRDVLISELEQVLKAKTLERARYYLRRLGRGVENIKTGKVNDINLLRWKEYEEVITDSLWVLPRRERAGAHHGWYWGNFIPQIPHQLMLRYTKKNEWVLDPFLGSGTTLIECRRLARNGVGIELNPEIAKKARRLISLEPNSHSVKTVALVGDSATVDLGAQLGRLGVKQAQLVIMHPPYADIIKFSEDSRDLSSAESAEEFLKMLGGVVDNVTPFLEQGRYLALVVGDKYADGEWMPLGFECMNEVLKRKYSLKSIIVKNFEETRAKRDQKQLWRYRALAGGFYIFKHEYIFLFKKK